MKLSKWQLQHFQTSLEPGDSVLIGLDESWRLVISRPGRGWYALDDGGGHRMVDGDVRELFDGEPLFESIEPAAAKEVVRPFLQRRMQ